MVEIKRRDFLIYSGLGLTAIVIGGCGSSGGGAAPAPGGGGDPIVGPIVDTLNFTITDAFKEMVTHAPDSPLPSVAECYFWVFKEDRFPVECPGPQVYCIQGDRIALNVTNELVGPHAFFIPGMVDTGPIAPGATWSGEFTAGAPGTYLYHDNLNAPVNRVMGLHGAFIVMPQGPAAGRKLTPYANPTAGVQALFDDFGSAPWWPGLSWEAGDPATHTAPTRQYIWLCHEASPVLFAEVGEYAQIMAGLGLDPDYPAADFVTAFVADPFVATSNDPRVVGTTTDFNKKPHFFTMNGQSGMFAHDHPTITPMLRVGEPCLIRILNAGLWTHSLHLHANHFYVTAINNVPQDIPIWVDVFNAFPMDHVDYVIPFMRMPDIPNVRGIGRADAPLPAAGGGTTWPPLQEFNEFFPPVGTLRQSFADPLVLVDIAERQSPLCYPMHDHTEPTQTAQGGNYNCGLIAGIYVIGDRNGMMDFPMEEEFMHMLESGGSTSATGPAAGLDIMHEEG